MNLFWNIVLFILGLALIIKGGDLFVDAAGWIAKASGIPEFVVGATIVSFATTLPELLVSAIAAAGGQTDMAVSNAVGSVNANLGLILGLSVLFLPSAAGRRALAPRGLLMALCAGLLWLFSRTGSFSLAGAAVMLAMFALFIVMSLRDAREAVGDEKAGRHKPAKKEIYVNILKFALGTAGIAGGAKLLVDYGSALARQMGVSEAVIGVTFIAVGTSLPELVTAITAITKKQAGMSVGNIIGANIIDLALILPVCGIVSGGALPVPAQSLRMDMPLCFVLCVLAVAPTLIFARFRRLQGAAMLAAYLAGLVILLVIA